MSARRGPAVGVPVVVVHKGPKPHVRFCLCKAADSNPRGRVVLLGDAANVGIGIGEHHPCDDSSLRSDVAEFRAVYEHHGQAETFRFERFCIERWFLVRNFMRRENLDRCLVIDSDVLLFCDVAEEADRFRDAAMTFARWDAARLVPHCNFVNGRDALESFCDHVLWLYRKPRRMEPLKALNAKKFGRHWISDMSLFHDWTARHGFRVGMLADALRDRVAYDDCIDRTTGFARRSFLPGLLRPWKRIDYRDGVPHARHEHAGIVPMKCLHFHGPLKALMERHARGHADDWRSAAIMVRAKLDKVPGKVRLFTASYLLPGDRAGDPAGARDRAA